MPSSFLRKTLGVPALIALLLPMRMVPAAAGRAVTPLRQACSSAWTIVPSGNIGRQSNVLQAVTAASTTDAWAVGYYAPGSITKPLIEHWDGSSFTVVPGATVSGRSSLNSVAAISTDDVWAVGSVGLNVLIEHWDGTAWTRTVTTARGDLTDVTAISSTDVWAVGFNGSDALTMHWDGITWTRVPTPLSSSALPQLFGVSGTASSDVWAVGTINDHSGVLVTLAIHWDGVSWTQVSTPNPQPPDSQNYLLSVEAISPADVWAVGWYVSLPRQALVEHWDGTTWNLSTPVEPEQYPGFSGVAAVSASAVWAVGDYLPVGAETHIQTLIQEWDGSAWSVAGSGNVGGTGRPNWLLDVDALPDGTALAVGYYSAPNKAIFQTLAEEICPA
jgi:hypothetical protein